MNDASSSGLGWVYGILVGTLAATPILGCGGGAASGAPASGQRPAADQQPGDGKPGFDLEAARKREAEKLADTKLADPGGAWSANVPAAGAPTISMDQDIAVIFYLPMHVMLHEGPGYSREMLEAFDVVDVETVLVPRGFALTAPKGATQ